MAGPVQAPTQLDLFGLRAKAAAQAMLAHHPRTSEQDPVSYCGCLCCCAAQQPMLHLLPPCAALQITWGWPATSLSCTVSAPQSQAAAAVPKHGLHDCCPGALCQTGWLCCSPAYLLSLLLTCVLFCRSWFGRLSMQTPSTGLRRRRPAHAPWRQCWQICSRSQSLCCPSSNPRVW